MREPLAPGADTVMLGDEPLCEDVQDIRTEMDGLSLRDVGNVYHHTLKCRAYAADPDPTHSTAIKLLRLINDERQALATLRKAGIDYERRQDFITKSARRREINALYLQLGMARMLTLGDWSVNRDEAIPVSMGVAPFVEIEGMLLNFYYEHGLIANTSPIREGKLVHLDLGCGNGVVANRLRQDETVYPFANGRVLLNYWAEVGYADFMYWTLNDFFRAFVKDEYRDNPALNEFIDVVSTLLMRRIHFGRTFGSKPSKEMETLLQLPTNPNVISEVLLHFRAYIKNLLPLKEIKADGEFLLDTDKPISEECRAIIREFYGSEDMTAYANRRFASKLVRQEAFLKKYFKPELSAIDRDLEKNVTLVTTKLSAASLALEECISQLRALKKDDPDYNTKRNAAIAEKIECDRRYQNLVRERNKLLEKRVDLAQCITIYPHNVILGDFEQFGDLFPEKPTFAFVHSVRATSHGQNPLYAAITEQVARRLKQGGIVIEDGKRESYTREERIDELVALQRTLGSGYRIGVIADGERPKSVLMQRAITKPDGTMVFFADSYGDKLIREGHAYCPIEEFETRWPEIIFRNWIIQRLKVLYIDASLEGATFEQVPSRVWNGRMHFRGLHAEVDRSLETSVFSTAEWKERLRNAHSSNPEYQEALDSAWQRIMLEIVSVRQRVQAVTDGAIPLRTGAFGTVSLRPREPFDEFGRISKGRHISVADMSRNRNVPDFVDLERERAHMVALLQGLRKATGAPPLVVVEFDKCFTNALLLKTLCGLVGKEAMRDLITVENVKLRSGKYPSQRSGVIYIIGGSLNDTYDPFGNIFTDRFSYPLVDRIQKNETVRAIGICFGHQSLVEAYGRVHQLPCETRRGSLEFGAFPVKFAGSHPCLTHLANQTCTTSMTRSGYTMVPNNVPDMQPLAYECSRLIRSGEMEADLEVPPVAFALEQGRIVTCQFHPDVRTSDADDRRVLRRYLARNYRSMQDTFGTMHFGLNSPHYIFNHNIALDAQDTTGQRTPWVAREVGPAFLIPTLTHLANSLHQAL